MQRRDLLKMMMGTAVGAALPWQAIASTIAELISNTIRMYSRQLVANVEQNNALLSELIKSC